MDLIQHIEKHVGRIENSWQLPDFPSFQVLRFRNQPNSGITTFCTLGMSRAKLHLPNLRLVKLEFIFSIKEGLYDDEDVASFLLTFTQSIIESGTAVLRGEVIGPGPPIFSNCKSNNIYCSIPVFFGDEFDLFDSKPIQTVFVWLIPLTETDANFIKVNGWRRFEDELEKIETTSFWNPDIPLLGSGSN